MKKFLIFLLALITSVTLYSSDVILSNTLGAYYCAQEPNPKTYIKHTVEEPISIYWEDNVYPGFDEADSKLMVANYLDGVHLQTMALNTPDGKVKIYSYANIPHSYIDLLKEGEEVKKEMMVKQKVFNQARNHKKLEDYPPDFNQIRDIYLKVMDKNEALTKQIETEKMKLNLIVTETTRDAMPQMNYTIKTDEVHLSDLARKVLYSDEVKITDNQTKEVIAYNRRITQLYSAVLLPDVGRGDRYYDQEYMCGRDTQSFERWVFRELGMRASNHATDLNVKLYYKYTTKDNK